MKSPVVALAFASMLAGCSGGSLTSSPTVYVDSSFAPDDVAGMSDGLRDWEDSVRLMSFHPVIVSHHEIVKRASAPVDNSVYLILNHGKNQAADCPTAHRGVPVGYAAWTEMDDSHPVVCFDVDDMHTGGDPGSSGLASYELYARYVFAHEMGHAMGLSHSEDSNDTMFPHAGNFVLGASCADAGRMADHWGLHAGECRR